MNLKHMSGWTSACWCAVCLLAFAAVAPVTAQERFELTEDFEWEKQTQYDPASPEGKLQSIRKMLAEGHPKTAEGELDQWIKDHPNHPRLVEAYLLRGDAKVAREHLYRALYDYETVIRRYPASEQFHTALQREFEIARMFANGKRRRMWGMRFVTAYGEAEEIFIRTQERAPGSTLGEKASIELADYYFRRSRMSAAAEAYDLFLQNYPNSDLRERAMLRLIHASLARFRGPRFDPTGLIDARERIRMYEQEFPASAERIGTAALLRRIHESLALKSYYAAQWYDQVGQDVSAAYMYREVVKDYPDTPAAELAMRELESMDEPLVDNLQNNQSQPDRDDQPQSADPSAVDAAHLPDEPTDADLPRERDTPQSPTEIEK